MSSRIVITDVSWHNIYLHLAVEGAESGSYNFYISDLHDHTYPIECKDNMHIIVNIVNIYQTKLLPNGKWYILSEMNGEYKIVEISKECGYRLGELDKVYRYGKEIYAYIITFSVGEMSEILKRAGNPVTEKMVYGMPDDEKQGELVLTLHASYMMLNKKNDKRNILVEASGGVQLIKKAGFIVLKKAIDAAYHLLAVLRKKDGKHILLLSETRTPIGGNLKALDDRMHERGVDKCYKISYSFSRTLQQSKWKTLFSWSRLLWLTAKQDIIFVDDYVPIFKTIHLTKETKLVQLWHAGVGFKSVGYSRFGKAGSPLPIDSCHRQYDYAIVGGEGLKDVYEEVFGIPKENILPFGLARLDGYMDREKKEKYQKEFYEKYPELKNKKIILFAPTYRGKTQDEAFYPSDWIEQEKIPELCGEEYVFGYKMHPFIKEKVVIDPRFKDYIYDFTNERDINELFYVTEILITDFSSNIYEFSLQKRPIIFYAPDKDFYQLTRGVHRTLDEAPGVVCLTFDEVIDCIQKKKFDIQKIEKFVKESFDSQTRYASDALIDELILKREEFNDQV